MVDDAQNILITRWLNSYWYSATIASASNRNSHKNNNQTSWNINKQVTMNGLNLKLTTKWKFNVQKIEMCKFNLELKIQYQIIDWKFESNNFVCEFTWSWMNFFEIRSFAHLNTPSTYSCYSKWRRLDWTGCECRPQTGPGICWLSFWHRKR